MYFFDDKLGKAVGIHEHIGKRPVFTAGNSDGDYGMLQYTSTGSGPHFGLIIHHTDSLREYAYDRLSRLARLSKGLDDAATDAALVKEAQNPIANIVSVPFLNCTNFGLGPDKDRIYSSALFTLQNEGFNLGGVGRQFLSPKAETISVPVSGQQVPLWLNSPCQADGLGCCDQ